MAIAYNILDSALKEKHLSNTQFMCSI